MIQINNSTKRIYIYIETNEIKSSLHYSRVIRVVNKIIIKITKECTKMYQVREDINHKSYYLS